MSQIEKGLLALVRKILSAVEKVARGGAAHQIAIVPEPGEKVVIFIVPEKDAAAINTMLEIRSGGEPKEYHRETFTNED